MHGILSGKATTLAIDVELQFSFFSNISFCKHTLFTIFCFSCKCFNIRVSLESIPLVFVMMILFPVSWLHRPCPNGPCAFLCLCMLILHGQDEIPILYSFWKFLSPWRITLEMANIEIHVPFIVRKSKKSGAEMVTFYSCSFLSYTHLSHFLCCFWFNIFLLMMLVNDCQWAYEKFNAITMHFQLISKSF